MIDTPEPRGCPTPGACSAAVEIADLRARLDKSIASTLAANNYAIHLSTRLEGEKKIGAELVEALARLEAKLAEAEKARDEADARRKAISASFLKWMKERPVAPHPIDQMNNLEKWLSEDHEKEQFALRERIAAIERERDEAIRQRDLEHEIVVSYEMLLKKDELRATIAAQSAALAKARELVERARLNLSYAKQDAVASAAEAESNRNAAFHDCVAALAAIDAVIETQA